MYFGNLGEEEHASARCRVGINGEPRLSSREQHGRISERKTRERSTGLSIGFSPMFDTIDNDPFRDIVDLIEDAIIPDS